MLDVGRMVDPPSRREVERNHSGSPLTVCPATMTPQWSRNSGRYGAGRGGFSLARPRPYTGPGGYISGDPCSAAVRGPPALIAWTGPRLLPAIYNGDPSGIWVGSGLETAQGQGMPKRRPRPRPMSGAGRGHGPGPAFFGAPSAPQRTLPSNRFYVDLATLLSCRSGGVWCDLPY